MDLDAPRLLLRTVSMETARVLRLGRIPEGLSSAPDYPVGRTRDAAGRVGDLAEPDGLGMFLIIRKSDLAVIGDCSAERERMSDRAVVWVSYEIARSAQLQGFAKEAIRSVVDWALQQPGVDRICAEILTGSQASQKVALAAGLTVMDTRRFGAIWCRTRTSLVEERSG